MFLIQKLLPLFQEAIIPIIQVLSSLFQVLLCSSPLLLEMSYLSIPIFLLLFKICLYFPVLLLNNVKDQKVENIEIITKLENVMTISDEIVKLHQTYFKMVQFRRFFIHILIFFFPMMFNTTL